MFIIMGIKIWNIIWNKSENIGEKKTLQIIVRLLELAPSEMRSHWKWF